MILLSILDLSKADYVVHSKISISILVALISLMLIPYIFLNKASNELEEKIGRCFCNSWLVCILSHCSKISSRATNNYSASFFIYSRVL